MSPSDGGQSIRTKSKSSVTDSSARRSLSSRLKLGTSSISAPARSMVAGATNRFFMLVGSMASSSGASRIITSYIDVSKVSGVDSESRGGVPLGVQVDHEDPVAELGQCRAEVYRRRGLSHPALLVGDRHDPGEGTGDVITDNRGDIAPGGGGFNLAGPLRSRLLGTLNLLGLGHFEGDFGDFDHHFGNGRLSGIGCVRDLCSLFRDHRGLRGLCGLGKLCDFRDFRDFESFVGLYDLVREVLDELGCHVEHAARLFA